MEISKTIKNIAALISAIIVIGGGLWYGFDLHNRAFSTPEKRMNGEQVLEQLSPAKVAADAVRDSIRAVNDSIYMEETKKTRKRRDSLLEFLVEKAVKQDCLNVRLNDQYYQLNQKINPER